MAKPILVANWKNHPGSLPEARTLIQKFSRQRALYKKITFFIAPPAPYLELVATKAKSFAKLASQNIFEQEKGTHTGEITPEILKSFGTRMTIVGHSERRALGESSIQTANKVRVALKAGITPLVCVGEDVRDSEGEHFEFLREQIKSFLSLVNKKEINKVVIAYEPVWAIGREAIEPVELSQTIIFIKKVLSDLFGRALAENVSILYGGSVDESNAQELLHTGVKGFLVGRASLNAKNLESITKSLITK